jgi:hypothetical protein
MAATVNGIDLLHAVITEPRMGAWTADIDCDSDDKAITGKVTIEIDRALWVGTVLRGDLASGHAHAFVIGGGGGLGTPLDAKFYVNVSLRTVISDILRASGETLSATSDQTLLGKVVPRWTRSQAVAGQAIRQVAEESGLSWRVLRDGSVWFGKESWPAARVEHDEIDRDPGRGEIEIAPEGPPSLMPGTTLGDVKISHVTTRMDPGGLRQEGMVEDLDSDGPGRMMRDFAAIIEAHTGNRIDYSRMYPARVLAQSGDGSLELLADNPKVRGTGVTQVPIRHGLPGVTVKVNPGARVLLFFEGGDPKEPAAALWPDGSSCSEIAIKAPTVTIDGDLFVTGEVTAMSAIPGAQITLSHHLHPTAMGPTSIPTPGS